MNKYNLERYQTVISAFVEKRITLKTACDSLQRSKREIYRLQNRYKLHGKDGLIHQNTGKIPHNTLPHKTQRQIFLIASTDLKNANFTHMSKLLGELYNINISRFALSRLLKKHNITSPQSHRPYQKRKSRPRRSSFGEMILADASKFNWFEGRGPELALLACMDDATGTITSAVFRPNEDLTGYFIALRDTVSKFGIPLEFYSDRHPIFLSPNASKLTLEDELAGFSTNLTQFGRAINELNINPIFARSPQAKGRIENLWRTAQSRLPIEFRINNVSTIDEANAYLKTFIKRFNEEFGKEPISDIPVFIPLNKTHNLDNIFCIKESRQPSKGSTISFRNKRYMLIDSNNNSIYLNPRSFVHVCVHIDSSLTAIYNNSIYKLKEFPKYEKAQNTVIKETKALKNKGHTPPPDHPWRKFKVFRYTKTAH